MEPNIPTYVIGKAGPSLFDIRIESSEIRCLVTGPGMLYESLRIVTSLGLVEGYHYRSLSHLKDQLEATAYCGSVGKTPLDIAVKSHRAGCYVEIDIGPTSMYQSEILIRSKEGIALGCLFDQCLTHHYIRDYMVALMPIPASGHMEHHHNTDTQPETGGHHHGHS